jgi:hypothetical protein
MWEGVEWVLILHLGEGKWVPSEQEIRFEWSALYLFEESVSKIKICFQSD